MHMSTQQPLLLLPRGERMAICNGSAMQPAPERSPLAPIITKLAEKVVTVAKGQAELVRVQTELAGAITHDGTTQARTQQRLTANGPLMISGDQLNDALAEVAAVVHEMNFKTGSKECTAFNPAKLPTKVLHTFAETYVQCENLRAIIIRDEGLEAYAVNFLGGVAESIIAKVNKLIKARRAEEKRVANEALAATLIDQARRMTTRSMTAKTN